MIQPVSVYFGLTSSDTDAQSVLEMVSVCIPSTVPAHLTSLSYTYQLLVFFFNDKGRRPMLHQLLGLYPKLTIKGLFLENNTNVKEGCK